MTDIVEAIDLSTLIDFDAPVVCDSRMCESPGEEAVAMVIYDDCKCRIPIGLACVQRIALHHSYQIRAGIHVIGHNRCGTMFKPPVQAYPGMLKIVSL